MTNPTTLRIALAQHRARPSATDNLDHIARQAEAAVTGGAHLLVLQELHNGPYFCQRQEAHRFELAEPVPGPTTDRLGAISRATGLVIVGSVFEQRGTGVFHNTAVVLERDGSLAGRYRKMHIPDDPGYYEKYYFSPGDLGFTPVDSSVGRLGLLVCWDQWFPEAARLMVLAGADVLVYPTAIGWDPNDDADEQARQLDAWRTVQRGHAIANGVPIVACNRCGTETASDGTTAHFWGHSFVAGPQGEILAQAQEGESLLMADVDRRRTALVRRVWPFLRDRRIDAYKDLNRRLID